MAAAWRPEVGFHGNLNNLNWAMRFIHVSRVAAKHYDGETFDFPAKFDDFPAKFEPQNQKPAQWLEFCRTELVFSGN